MKFLPKLDKENVMLVNIIYHNGTKAIEYVDYIDIVYKDLRTGEKFVETIKNPEFEIYFAKPEYRNYNYNKSFIELDQTDMHTCKFRNVVNYVAKEAGLESWVRKCREEGNWGKTNNIHKHYYVFGSDYDIENWYRIQWVLHNHNEKTKPITKQYLDIEVDGVDVEGFPRDGECPINAVTIVDEETLTSYTFLLRNEKNPQIQKFEDNIDRFVDKLHVAFDETYGSLNYRIYMYDDERDLIKDLFKLINTLKRDFLMIWNGFGFDIPYIIARCQEIGLDATQVMCHKDFPLKEIFFKKDTKNFKPENQSDYFKISSYTVYIDQMRQYAGLRKGRGELRSFSLNAIAQEEIDDEKLDYAEEANIKTLPYVDYEKFVMYGIKDVLLQMGIEKKTGDIDDVYQRAYSNATSYHKIFKQTVFLKNRAYIEYYKQGLIIGNNINVEYGVYNNGTGNDDDEEKFDGALVADPTLNLDTGIDIFGAKSMYIFDNVVDMDFSSMYPHIIIAFNIAPNCMIGKLIIGKEYIDIYNDVRSAKDDDGGKDFVDNLLIYNVANMGTKWFGLPALNELITMFQEHFKPKELKRVNVGDKFSRAYYAEGLDIII